MLARWRSLHHDYLIAGLKEPSASSTALVSTWLTACACREDWRAGGCRCRPAATTTDKGAPRVDNLIGAWIHALVAAPSACR